MSLQPSPLIHIEVIPLKCSEIKIIFKQMQGNGKAIQQKHQIKCELFVCPGVVVTFYGMLFLVNVHLNRWCRSQQKYDKKMAMCW